MNNRNRFVVIAVLAMGIIIFKTKNGYTQTTQQEMKIDSTEKAAASTDNESKYVRGITPGRARSLVGGVLGLVSIILGWRSKNRSSKTGAKVALVLALAAIVLSVLHLSTSAGAVFGSGSGKAGAIVALPLALIGAALGILTLRSASGRIA